MVFENEIWSQDIEQILPDFEPGPLDKYRKQSSIKNWRNISLTLEDEEALRFKVNVYKCLPLYMQ